MVNAPVVNNDTADKHPPCTKDLKLSYSFRQAMHPTHNASKVAGSCCPALRGAAVFFAAAAGAIAGLEPCRLSIWIRGFGMAWGLSGLRLP